MNYTLNRTMSLITGLSLLAMAALAGFAYGYGFEQLYDATDAKRTVQNLISSPQLLRWVIFAFILILILDVVVAWALYFLLKAHNRTLALLSSWLRLSYAALLGVALLSLVLVAQVLSIPSVGEDLIAISIRTFLAMWSWGLFVFGVHLLLLGYLLLKAHTFPSILGYLAIIAAICYIITSLIDILLIDVEQLKKTMEMILALPMAAGELALAFWLLVKGGKIRIYFFRRSP